MTLIVGLAGKDGIVLAADSRGISQGTHGAIKEDNHNKLFKLSKHIGIAAAGELGIANNLVDKALHGKKNKFRDEDCPFGNLGDKRVDEIIEGLAEEFWLSYSCSFGYNNSPSPRATSVQMLVVGYGSKGNPHLYLLSHKDKFSPSLRRHDYVVAGMPNIAMVAAQKFFKRDMPVESLKRLATYMVSESIKQYPNVGGPIRVAVITPDNGYSELSESEITAICCQNDEQAKSGENAFFGEDANGAK